MSTEKRDDDDVLELYSKVGVTLQDLINIVAYQEYVENGTIEPKGETIIHIQDKFDEEQE